MKTLFLSVVLLCFFLLSACGSQAVVTQEPATILPPTAQADDPCSSENLPDTVQGTNDLMREFEDASQLAANLPIQQLPDVISDLQRIRRDAQDLPVPACLETLKAHQLNHMNLMIQTLIAFVGGADQATLNSGLEQARQEHELYSLEIVRLLGLTLAPITPTSPAASPTP